MPMPPWIRRCRLPGSRLVRRRGADNLRSRLQLLDLEQRVLLSVVIWKNLAGGDWSVAGNWDLGRLPGPTDDVLIPNLGFFSVTHARGSDTVHSLTADRPLILSGGTLTVAGSVRAGSPISLSGGTLSKAIVAIGTTLTGSSSGGTLDQVTLNGNLDLAGVPEATAVITGGLTLNGTVTLGDNTTTNAGVLHVAGAQTLSGTGTIQFGHAAKNTVWTTGGLVTIGRGLTIHGQVGYVGWNPNLANTPDATFVNQGTIQADSTAGMITVLGSGWSNTGTLHAQNGATLELTASSGQTWTNSGLLAATGGTLLLGSAQSSYSANSSFSLDSIGTFDTKNGTVFIGSTLNNTSRTLALNAGSTGSWRLRQGGVINGGTITTAGGARLIGTNSPGNLSGVTLNGDLDLTTNTAAVTVSGGLTLNGTITLGSTLASAKLTFLGTQTLAGTGTILLAGNSPANQLTTTNQSTLTVAAGITIRGTTGTLGYVAGADDSRYPSFNLQGTVAADTPGGTITIHAADWTSSGNLQALGGTLNLQGTWTNSGRITAAANGLLNLGEPGQAFSLANSTVLDTVGGSVNVTGILNNTGKTLTLNANTTGSWRLAAASGVPSGQILGGTVLSVGGARLIGTPGGGSLSGVVLGADLDLGTFDGAQVTVLNGLSFNGTISLGNAAGSTHGTLTFAGDFQALNGSGSIVFGPNALNDLDTRNSLLTIAAGLTIRGYSGTIDGTFDNHGTLAADRAGGTITLRGPAWSNEGNLLAQNGGTITALVPPANFANGTLTGGTWQVSANSTLRLVGVHITTAAAAILLDGANANLYSDAGTTPALDTFAVIAVAGTFTVQNGANFAAAATFRNAGALTVGANSTFQATLNNLSAGTLTGGNYLVQGTLRLNNADDIHTNQATVTLRGPTALITDGSGGNALAGLRVNDASGQLTFLDGGNFTTGGAFTNSGTLAVGVGSSFFATTLTNYDAGSKTLTGGTFVVGGTLRFTGADIQTNAANLTLDGPAAQVVDPSSQDALAHLASNTGSGTFTVQNGRNLTTAGMFLNNGTLAVGPGSTFFANSLANFVAHHLIGGTFLIGGTLQFTGADIQTNDANTVLIGPNAAIVNEVGVNALGNFNLNDYVGTFGTSNGSTFTPRSDFRNLGAVTIGAGSTVTLNPGDQVGGGGALHVLPGGTLLMAGTAGTGTILNTVINDGQIIVQHGTTLDLAGGLNSYIGGVLTGGIYDLAGSLQFPGADVQTNRATLNLNGPGSGILNGTGGDGLAHFSANDAGASLTLENGRTLTAAGSFRNDGTLIVAAGSSLTVTGTYTHSGSLIVQDQAAFNLAGTGTFSAGIVSGAGSANITGRLTWTGGSMVGPGTTTIAAGARLDISGTSDKALNGRSLVNAGTVTWSGSGNIAGGNGASVQNQPGALFDAQSDTGLIFNGGTPAAFTNAGTVRKSAGTGTTLVAAGWTFQNAGALEVLAGTLNLSTTLQNFDNVTHTLTGGTYRLQGQLQFTGADIQTNAAAIILNGANAAIVNEVGFKALDDLQLNASGASITVMNGRTLNLGGPGNRPSNAGALVLGTGGALSLGADLTSTGSVAWTGGRLAGPGTLDVAGGGTLAVSGTDDKYLDPGAGVRIDGTATWTGPGALWLAQGSSLTVMAGGTFDAQDNGSIRAAGSGGLITNQGVFLKSAGTGTTLVDTGIQFTNAGAIKVLTGTLDLEANLSNLDAQRQTLTGGTYDVLGTLKLAGANLRTNAAAVILDGPGSALVNSSGSDALAGLSLNDHGGSLTLRNGRTFRTAGALTNAGALVVELNADLSLGGTLTDTGNVSWTGGRVSGTGILDVASGGLLSLDGSADKSLAAGGLMVEGTTTWAGSGGLWLADGGSITIAAGGTFEAQADGTLGLNGSGTARLTNQGTFRKSAGTGSTLIGAAISFNNPGTIEVLTGILDLEGPFSQFNATTGTLTGGTYTLAGILKFPGVAIQTNAAALVLDGAGSGIVNQTGQDALAGLSLNDHGGSLTLRNQRTFQTAGPLTNAGILVVEWNAGLSLAATLTNSGTLSWSSGRLSGPGVLDVAAGGTLTLTGADDKVLDLGAAVQVEGSVTWSGGGGLVLGDGSRLTVLASGTFDAQDDGTIRAGGTTAAVVNQGTFRKSAGTGSTLIGAGVSFSNAGTVEVQSGTLDLEGSFTNFDGGTRTLTGGTYFLTSALTFPNARIVTNAAAIFLNGPNAAIVDQAGNDALAYLATNTAAGSLSLSGRTLSTLGAVVDAGTMTLAAGGTLDLGDTFRITGVFFWTGGNVTGSGAMRVDPTGSLEISGVDDKGVDNSGGLFIDGQADWSGMGRMWVPKESEITVMAGGVFDSRGEGDITTGSAGPMGGFILNQGLFRKSAGGVTLIEAGVSFLNEGTVEVDKGTLDLEGTFINFDTASQSLSEGTFVLQGVLEFPNAAIVTNAAAIVLDGPNAAITDDAGNDALVYLSTNAARASLTLQNGANVLTNGSFANAGTILVGQDSTFLTGGDYTQDGGSTALANGSLAAGTVAIENGVLSGAGTIYADVMNAGELDVGGAGAAGILNIVGDFTQTASGVLSLELGSPDPGSGYDQLNISGNASLDGILNVTLLDSFFAHKKDQFQVLTFGSHQGDFAQTNLPDLGGRLYLDPVYDDGSLTLITRGHKGIARE